MYIRNFTSVTCLSYLLVLAVLKTYVTIKREVKGWKLAVVLQYNYLKSVSPVYKGELPNPRLASGVCFFKSMKSFTFVCV